MITTADPLLAGMGGLQRHWGWMVILGILLILLGTFALGSSVYVTLVSMVFLGSLLLIAGAMNLVGAFRTRDSGGFVLYLLSAVLDVVLGILILRNPTAGAAAITLLIAAFLLAGGAFRMGMSLMGAGPNSGWVFLSGLVNILLGLALIFHWPYSGLWFIGLCIGIELIFSGWSWFMSGLAARKLPKLA